MRLKLAIALLLLAALLAGALVLLGISSAHPRNSHLALTIKDTTFQFQLVEITRGTNHVMYTGNPATATFKRVLCESGVGPVMKLARRIHAQSYQRTTPTNSTVLWLGWVRTNHISTTGPPFTDTACFISQPDGRTTQLRSVRGAYTPELNQEVWTWELPAALAPFSGCLVNLKVYKEQPHRIEDVATVRIP